MRTKVTLLLDGPLLLISLRSYPRGISSGMRVGWTRARKKANLGTKLSFQKNRSLLRTILKNDFVNVPGISFLKNMSKPRERRNLF